MTAVIIRRVENRLERMIKARSGIRVSEALEAASRNLQSIEDVCRRELDERLRPILSFGSHDPRIRPTDEALADLVYQIDRALTACGALNLPRLGKALILLSAMADALSQSNYWPEGALTPAISLVGLLRNGGADDPDADMMLAHLQQCLGQYIRHADNT